MIMANLDIKALIAEAEKKIALAKAEIAKAKSAGVNVALLEAQLLKDIDALNNLKAAYGK